MSTWTKLAALPSKSNPCLCCPPILSRAEMEKVIAVGFGSADVTRDGENVYREPSPQMCEMCEGLGAIEGEDKVSRPCPACGGKGGDDSEPYWTFADAENAAKADPDHDWRVTMFGPLHGETYQRHGDGEWNLVEKNEGFA